MRRRVRQTYLYSLSILFGLFRNSPILLHNTKSLTSATSTCKAVIVIFGREINEVKVRFESAHLGRHVTSQVIAIEMQQLQL
mmetsp:Transcript_13013/g.28511  ORF Transcript_13013/g.28511 Transcript_13013/m.28511 type:complete len:82 (+) Transcript_13013:797-1042(+)